MTDISSGVGGCVAIKDVKVPAKSPPFGKGEIQGIFQRRAVGDWENLPWPLFSKEGKY